ncbi:hypothetical protein SANTM175S_00070 [Streptomyces antimycoticus]
MLGIWWVAGARGHRRDRWRARSRRDAAPGRSDAGGLPRGGGGHGKTPCAAALITSALNILADQGAVACFHRVADVSFAAVGAFSLFLLGVALPGGPLLGSPPALTLGGCHGDFCLGVTLYGEQPRTGFWLVPALLGLSVLLYGIFGLSHTRCLAQCVDRSRDELGGLGEPAAARG